uniref:Uncharacterized protein n=1 Tax=Heterorhabditis bacteriophora TaxID=37862 RepID=A0A1I7X0A6_HETBA
MRLTSWKFDELEMMVACAIYCPILEECNIREIMSTLEDHKKRKAFNNMVPATHTWPSGSRRPVGCGGRRVDPGLSGAEAFASVLC